MGSNVSGPGKVVAERVTKKIHVSELQIGMWVSQLDRDWLETPFIMQGFLVESIADVETVCQFCEHVWVDAVEEKWAGKPSHQAISATPKRRVIVNQVSSIAENRAIFAVYKKARIITRSLLDEVRLTSFINTDSAKGVVKDCVSSVIRNADALTWLSKIRSQDEYTSEHCLNVCILAIAFGRQLGYEGRELIDLGLCGLLHDVGKMKVPHDVLNKPAKLTPKEFKIIQRHTVFGRNLLLAAGSDVAQAVDVAWCHHERPNGQGYPRKLTAESISRMSRIISIVDAFDAMTADRCYKPAKTSTEALKIIFRTRGTHFDKELAELFIQTIGLYPPGTVVELMGGQVGLVLESNHHFRQLPKIIVLRDSIKEPMAEQLVDLALVEQGKLGKEFLIREVHPDGAFGVSVRNYQEQGKLFKIAN